MKTIEERARDLYNMLPIIQEYHIDTIARALRDAMRHQKSIDDDVQPEGMPLTKEMLDKNGFRYEEHHGPYCTRSIIGDYRCTSKMCVSVTWHKSPEGLRVPYFIDCINEDIYEGNSATIKSNLYVHTLQHALRLVGLSEIADNFKV